MSIKNVNDVSMEAFVKALSDETAAKATTDTKGNARRSIALRLCMTYPDTYGTWTKIVKAYESGDDKLRSEAREKVELLVVHKNVDTALKSNHVNRAIESMIFATSMMQLDYADCIVFNEKGGAMVSGNSPLMLEIWRVLKWHDNKAMETRSTSEPVTIKLRHNGKKPGEISWVTLDGILREKTGRKVKSSKVIGGGKVLSPDQPIELLKTIGSMAGDVDPVHFKNDASLIAAINTSEDVLALALSNDKLKSYAKKFEELYEAMRADLHIAKNVNVKAA